MPRLVELGAVPFAVVDLETTGISPWHHHRVVEVAVVRMDPRAGILEEYSTLVNPERDIGPTHIHGIRAADVVKAPRFADIAGDVASRLADAVIVAHNARFDQGFLVSEYTRAGVEMPSVPMLCTLGLGRKVRPDLPRRRLIDCCEEAGVAYGEDVAHMALNDARATAHLLAAYLASAGDCGLRTAEDLGCKPLTLPDPWCPLPRTDRRLTRHAAQAQIAEARTYLARLVEKLPPTPFEDPDEACYLELLDRVLEDRRVMTDEADELFRTAEAWGLTRAKVFETHHNYLASLVRVALADELVTSSERTDLEDVCSLLGLHPSALETLLPAAKVLAKPRPSTTLDAAPVLTAAAAAELRGLSVCFTGELTDTIGGQRIDREAAERLAAAAGLIVRNSVSKKLGLLVVSDADSASGKARRARELGIRVMAPPVFWKAIGVRVD